MGKRDYLNDDEDKAEYVEFRHTSAPTKYNVEQLKSFDFSFNEDKYLSEMEEYIRSTYEEHYATNSGDQTIATIIRNGHGEGFCMGNIQKYVGRYGKKEGYNRKDLIKMIHYAILMLHVHDIERTK